MHWSFVHPGDDDREEQYHAREIKGHVIDPGPILDISGKERHQEGNAPANVHQTVVHAQVLGPEEVRGVSRHQGQGAAVLKEGNTQRHK